MLNNFLECVETLYVYSVFDPLIQLNISLHWTAHLSSNPNLGLKLRQFFLIHAVTYQENTQ